MEENVDLSDWEWIGEEDNSSPETEFKTTILVQEETHQQTNSVDRLRPSLSTFIHRCSPDKESKIDCQICRQKGIQSKIYSKHIRICMACTQIIETSALLYKKGKSVLSITPNRN